MTNTELADELERVSGRRFLAEVIANFPLILSSLRRVEKLEGALEDFDASYAKCPFSPEQQRPADRSAPCPSCGATPRDPCGKFVGSASQFVNVARAALTGEAS